MAGQIDSRELRNTMGQFSTGVVIVTGALEGVPVGFAAQSFVSLSLDPPLVAVCPGKSSTSWPKIRDSGSFCINVLGAQQKAVCDTFATSGGDKFTEIDWRGGATGSPVIDGVLAFVDCSLEAEHDAGDHTIAVGRIQEFAIADPNAEPLLFFRGGYGRFNAL